MYLVWVYGVYALSLQRSDWVQPQKRGDVPERKIQAQTRL